MMVNEVVSRLDSVLASSSPLKTKAIETRRPNNPEKVPLSDLSRSPTELPSTGIGIDADTTAGKDTGEAQQSDKSQSLPKASATMPQHCLAASRQSSRQLYPGNCLSKGR